MHIFIHINKIVNISSFSNYFNGDRNDNEHSLQIQVLSRLIQKGRRCDMQRGKCALLTYVNDYTTKSACGFASRALFAHFQSQ